MTKNISIIGTGLMGYPMAQNISKFFRLKVYNRTKNKTIGLENFNIKICESIDQVCKDCDFLITMLPSDNEVLDITPKLIQYMKKNSVVIDMSSTKVNTAKKIYTELKNKNINFLDAPVSGGPEGAKKATLAIMVGGDQNIFEKSTELLKTMGEPTWVGLNGSGQVAKLCNQIIVGINIGAVAEAIILCEKNGVDPKKLIKALKGGFADSLVLRNHGIRMIEKDFIPRGKNSTHLKDMINILEQANKNDLDLPISKIIKLMFENLCKSGFSNDDHSSLYNEILKNSGAHSQN